jgi:hypothetical protein
VDTFLTPGGHRRFLRTSLERFLQEHHRSRLPALPQQKWVDDAIAHTRTEIPHQRWVTAYGEEERETQRHLGRRLLGITLQFIAGPQENPDILSEARLIGVQHARNAMQRGQTLLDLLQAISFFRTTVLEVALLELPHTLVGQPETSGRLLRRIEKLLNEVQTGVVELYQGGSRE